MRFKVLGPIEVETETRFIDLGPPKQVLAAAVLLCRVGQVVTDDLLVDVLWRDEPPPNALGNLRLYIMRLRKSLGKSVIERSGNGYRLCCEPGQLDSQEFLTLVDQARKERRPTEAADRYRKALALWRGPAFGQHAEHAVLASTARWWNEQRLTAIDEWMQVRIDLGEHVALLPELSHLVAQYPLRESFHGHRMLALYRSGRRAEALDAYQAVRETIADELGADPSQQLKELHQAILTDDPSLAPATELRAEADRVVPHQLPADLPSFTGRAGDLIRLCNRLTQETGTMVISVLSGGGGVGKTSLAVRAGHQVAEHFPDGTLYVSLQGFTPDSKPLEPIQALGSMVRSLGVDTEKVPTDLHEAAALFRSLTFGKRLLILLDNAYDSAQVRPLLPGSPTCAVLITSRRTLSSLDGTDGHSLNVLPCAEALELLTRLLGDERMDGQEEDAARIAALCGYLPLALSIAAARLNARTEWPLKKIADRLAVEDRRLTELQLEDRAVRASIAVSHQDLNHLHSRAFRQCALPDGPDLPVDAAAALLDMPEPDAEDLLDDLVSLGLVESPSPGRYRYHDLVRLFAQEQTAELDSQEDRDKALHRVLAFYTTSTVAAVGMVSPNWVMPGSLLPAEHPGRAHRDPAAARKWLHEHATHMIGAVAHGARRPRSLPLAADQLYLLKWMAYSGAGTTGIVSTALAVIESAVRTGDTRSEALARRILGGVYSDRPPLAEAEPHLKRAAELSRVIGDQQLLADTRYGQGRLHLRQGHLTDAVAALTEAAELCKHLDRPYGEAVALSILAQTYVRNGQHDRALDAIEDAYAASHRSGSSSALGLAAHMRGTLLSEMNRPYEAIESLNEALRVFAAEGAQYNESDVLIDLAKTYRQVNQHDAAIDTATRCVALGRNTGNELVIGRAHAAIGQSLNAQGRREEGHAHLRDGLAILERLGAPEADHILTLLATAE
ncbi:BTAD domain-containing putative transcriptional regulator [Nonomuraea sp. B10E15]|uniref:AfsR/SARP family transcriptional regulator n=1 Tax=Nonomuraea sp. B10E15 TaxID=3153560 RepID=UPI00325DB7CB